MHFFEKQRVGLIGQTSVSLQKILIFFMICNLFSFFSGGFFQFFLCLIGFIGAYKKRTCLLSIYFWVNISLILFSLFSIAYITFSAPPQAEYQSSAEYVYIGSTSSASGSSAATSHWDSHALTAAAHKFALWAAASSSEPQQSSEATESSAPTSPPQTYSSSSTSSMEAEAAFFSFGFIFAIILVFIFAYLQAKALALAWRLRKLLLLPSIPTLTAELPTATTTTAQAPEQVHYFPAQDNSCAEAQPAPAAETQVNPAAYNYAAPPAYPYYPQPYGVPQGMMMVPHQPTYWGQPPVYYYSYPPQAQQPQADAETKQ